MMKFSLCAAFFPIAALTLAEPAVARPCGIAGEWQLAQGNGAIVNLRVVQFGNHLFGDARYPGGTGVIRDGWTDADKVSFRIDWAGPDGEYTGNIHRGRMSGKTFDIRTPRSQTTWFVTRKFAC